VWDKIETLQTMREALREQQFQAILDLGVKLQDILQEIKKLHNAYPLPEGVKSVANTPDCILDTPRKHDDGLAHCKILESLRTHIRRIRHGTIPPATQLQNHRETFTVTFLTQTTLTTDTLSRHHGQPVQTLS
jgi:hypothetical protein